MRAPPAGTGAALRAGALSAVTLAAEDFEARLKRMRERADPRAGLFGPGSKLWEVNRHSLIFLGAGRAALLQLAHPWVAQAIHDHSPVLADPVGRFNRTFLRVFAMVYGDTDQALHAARRVRQIHAGITGVLDEDAGRFVRGTRYRATDPEALLWVHATLWETSVGIFERFVRPLDPDEKQAYYTETRRFAALFDIPDAQLPAHWPAFEAWFHEVLAGDTLHVGSRGAEIASFLFRPLHPTLAPLTAWYRQVTAALLPPGLRRGFDLPERTPHAVTASLEWIRRSHPFWPRRLRYLPPYLAASRRSAGNRRPDPLGLLLERALLGASPRSRKVR